MELRVNNSVGVEAEVQSRTNHFIVLIQPNLR